MAGGDLSAGGEDGDGDGEVEGGAFFPKVTGGEVADHEAVWEDEVAVFEGGADSFLGFLDGFVGESDEGEFGHSSSEVDFGHHGEGVDAAEGGGLSLGDHRVRWFYPLWAGVDFGGRGRFGWGRCWWGAWLVDSEGSFVGFSVAEASGLFFHAEGGVKAGVSGEEVDALAFDLLGFGEGFVAEGELGAELLPGFDATCAGEEGGGEDCGEGPSEAFHFFSFRGGESSIALRAPMCLGLG